MTALTKWIAATLGHQPRDLAMFERALTHSSHGDDQPLDNTDEFTVPPNTFFMMGDNRDDSADSRDPTSGVGFVPAENLVGKAQFIFFSTDGYARWWEVWKWPFTIRYRRLLSGIR